MQTEQYFLGNYNLHQVGAGDPNLYNVPPGYLDQNYANAYLNTDNFRWWKWSAAANEGMGAWILVPLG